MDLLTFHDLKEDRSNARSPDVITLVTQEERPQRRICRSATNHKTEFEKFPRFGPVYSTDEAPILRGLKEAAWQHVLEKTEGDNLEITEKYLTAIRDVAREAMGCYHEDVREVMSESEFRWMMLKDGCFLLQLAILILGGSSLLGYPEDHILFGRSSKRTDIKRWLNSILYVGNQIPLVVLWKLKEQSFYNELLKKKTWEEPSDLLKRTLYEFLLFPSTGKKMNSSWQVGFPAALQARLHPATNYQSHKIRPPSDLLHGLHSFLIRAIKNPMGDKTDDMIDLEFGVGEDVDHDKEFPSATELSQKGIHFKNVQGGIYFKSGTIWAVLFMPTFTVDDQTLLIFDYLKSYENAQQPKRKNKREVCAYLKFMSELVRTKDDVKLLADKGIIKADPARKENLPKLLRGLAQGESSQNLRHLRLQINEYSRPTWWKYKEILSIAFVFTLAQTVLATLSYLHDLQSSSGK